MRRPLSIARPLFRGVIVLGALAAFIAVRTAAAYGIHLAWDDCGAAGHEKVFFGCETNTGPPYALFGSFIPVDGMTAYVGFDAVIDVVASQDSMPDWWKHGAGMCRGTTGLSTSVDFTTGPFTCEDVFFGQALSVMSFMPGSGGPNTARLRIQAAMPLDYAVPLDASKEYYAFRVNVQRARTVGDGSCTGCSVPVCLFLEYMQLYQRPELGFDPMLTGFEGVTPTWQNAYLAYPEHSPVLCIPLDPVATTRVTWGRIKSLYR